MFPYRDLDGSMNGFCRRRLHQPLIDKDGKQIRYLQPKDVPQRAYFPAGCLDKLRDGQSAIFITEGEKKSLALS